MPDILWHGSPVKVDRLVPNQAADTGFAKGCQFAVYATSNRNMAICFALGCIENDPEGKTEVRRTMMPEYGDKMLFEGCHPNYGGKGYLYKLDGSGFVHAMGSQWTCYEEIQPLEIIELDVDDHLDLCIVL
ncbi:MAG: hypothetical protein IJM34_13380 [Lachnospiraceae bacterium]|nr:hypothetical protein [Lachnospiraceae bacterium]